MQNVPCRSIILPKCAYQFINSSKVVHTSSFIHPKCTYQFFHLSKMCIPVLFPELCGVYHQLFHSCKMCIPGLSSLQIVYTSSFINPKCAYSSFIPPKCAYHFLNSSKMCLPVLSMIKNVHISSFPP